jgi:RNA polymerase sigma-70 factor (ECF subfamily)
MPERQGHSGAPRRPHKRGAPARSRDQAPDPRCRRIFAALSQYLDGELPASHCRELERHLKGCEPCLVFLATLKTTIEACRNFPPRKVPPPSPRVRTILRRAVFER